MAFDPQTNSYPAIIFNVDSEEREWIRLIYGKSNLYFLTYSRNTSTSQFMKFDNQFRVLWRQELNIAQAYCFDVLCFDNQVSHLLAVGQSQNKNSLALKSDLNLDPGVTVGLNKINFENYSLFSSIWEVPKTRRSLQSDLLATY